MAEHEAQIPSRSLLFCSFVRGTLPEADSPEAMLGIIGNLESAAELIEAEHPNVDLTPVRREIDALTELALDDGKVEDLKSRADRVLRQMNDVLPGFDAKIKEKTEAELAIKGLIEKPRSVVPNIKYRNGESHVPVVFSERAVSEIQSIDTLVARKLFRALNRGFVTPDIGTGIHHVRDVDKQLIMVRYLGQGTKHLVGCVKDGVISIKQTFQAKGQPGEWMAFKNLCN